MALPLDQHAPAFASLFDPDYRGFLHPDDMVNAIAHYCRQTGQAEPGSPPAYVRAILESLAFKYRRVLDSLEEVTGTRFEQIRIVGGGSRNRLLCQLTADAAGRPVLAGPVEATSFGNILVQAFGAEASTADLREMVRRSTVVQRYQPRDPEAWSDALARFEEVRSRRP